LHVDVLVCPLLWFAGIYIIFVPLANAEAGEDSPFEKNWDRRVRETELKWARRCLLAIPGLWISAMALYALIR